MKKVLNIIINYILYIAATLIPFFLSIGNAICQLILSEDAEEASKKAKQDAIDTNIHFNKNYDSLWKVVLIKKEHWDKIGKEGETLSYLTAKAWRDKYLRDFGYIVKVVLNIVFFGDWFKGGHLKATINKYENKK